MIPINLFQKIFVLVFISNVLIYSSTQKLVGKKEFISLVNKEVIVSFYNDSTSINDIPGKSVVLKSINDSMLTFMDEKLDTIKISISKIKSIHEFVGWEEINPDKDVGRKEPTPINEVIEE